MLQVRRNECKLLRLHHGSYRVKVRQGGHVEQLCLPRALCANGRVGHVPKQVRVRERRQRARKQAPNGISRTEGHTFHIPVVTSSSQGPPLRREYALQLAQDSVPNVDARHPPVRVTLSSRKYLRKYCNAQESTGT